MTTLTVVTELAVPLICKAIPGVSGIYLFGSIGTPYETPASDVDLAILPTKTISTLKCWKLAQKVAETVQRDVDLIDLLQASTVFRFQIISTGKRIYCRDKNSCDRFEMTVYSTYLRFNEERREILEDIKKRGRIYNG
ncbi:type II toxin-antitoxin system antitoxin [soil metagenome]